MKNFFKISIAFLAIGCSDAPEAVVEKWHVYEVPMSDCEIYSEVPCTTQTLSQSFDSESAARQFAKQKYEERDNVLWVLPSKETVKSAPEVITEVVDKEVYNYVNSDDTIAELTVEVAVAEIVLENKKNPTYSCMLPDMTNLDAGKKITLYTDSCETQEFVCDAGTLRSTVNLSVIEYNTEFRNRTCTSGRSVSRTVEKDYSVCRDVTKDQYFPTSKPYLSNHVNEWFQPSQVNASYPFAECRSVCEVDSNLNPKNESACLACELKQQPDHCFAKRNFYVPHNSQVKIKIDEL